MGGGAVCGPVVSGLLRGGSFGFPLLDVRLLDEAESSAAGGGAWELSSSLAPGRGLGGSGGGTGRVADGASGISWGFCCAAIMPANDTASSPKSNNANLSPNRSLRPAAVFPVVMAKPNLSS